MALKEVSVGDAKYLLDDEHKVVYIQDTFMETLPNGVKQKGYKWRDTGGSFDQFLKDLDRLAPKAGLDDEALVASEVDGWAALTPEEAKAALVAASRSKFLKSSEPAISKSK